ncbi:MAG: 2-octaprenyl-6-methoxyphenyl hydroxylase [Pseudomonadota bacterium]
MSGRHDVIVTGGGLVGASLAIGLARRGLTTALVEAHPYRAAEQPSYDDRTLALNHASCRILDDLGIWPGLGEGVTPIREVRVSARGRLGTAVIAAEDMQVDALGHVIEGRLIGRAVIDALPAVPGLTVFNPARVTTFHEDRAGVVVDIDGEDGARTLHASVLAGADGAESTIRRQLGLACRRRDYGQSAIIANVTPERAHAGRAFERFTDTGPVAMLPHQGQRCGSVWVTTDEQADALMALDDDAYQAQLQERFGYRLGRLKRIGRRSRYPLRLVHAAQTVSGRTVVLGNAAHTIHNVAAQGFNLGLRDVATLIDCLVVALDEDRDPADALLAYQAARTPDTDRIVSFTDTLIDAFAVDLPLLEHLPALGIMLVDRIPALKRALARRTMGYGGSGRSAA